CPGRSGRYGDRPGCRARCCARHSLRADRTGHSLTASAGSRSATRRAGATPAQGRAGCLSWLRRRFVPLSSLVGGVLQQALADADSRFVAAVNRGLDHVAVTSATHVRKARGRGVPDEALLLVFREHLQRQQLLHPAVEGAVAERVQEARSPELVPRPLQDERMSAAPFTRQVEITMRGPPRPLAPGRPASSTREITKSPWLSLLPDHPVHLPPSS